jgi:hypothetical protein
MIVTMLILMKMMMMMKMMPMKNMKFLVEILTNMIENHIHNYY